jgi:uncharacterized protein (DUF2236 family)
MSDSYFGPDSMMWRVNREVTTLFGGARALLMQAAHPLIAAGARQTGGYRRDPWQRLIRTVRSQNMLIFGTRRAADETADRINKLHRSINGVDPVTGEWYDALDYDQLLWVHLALEISTIDFYTLTVCDLSTAERDRYHEEHKTVAGLLLLPADHIPATYEDGVAYLDDLIGSGRLVFTDVAAEVAELITTAAVPARIRPLWRLIALAAVGTLDPRLRHLYGLEWNGRREALLRANLATLRAVLPVLPRRFRYIVPARWADLRLAHPLPVTDA